MAKNAEGQEMKVKRENLPIPLGPRGLEFNDATVLWSFCQWVGASAMVPKNFRGKPVDIFAAVTFGMGFGLDFWTSMTSVAVINGMPSLYGPAQKAIVEAAMRDGEPLLKDDEEFFERDGEKMYHLPPLTDDEKTAFNDTDKAVVSTWRLGREKPCRREYSVGDAKQAGLWMKRGEHGGPSAWVTHPADMLMYRARAKNYRMQFSDVLKGAYLPDEVREIVDTEYVDVSPKPDGPTPGRASVRGKRQAKAKAGQQEDSGVYDADADDWVRDVRDLLTEAPRDPGDKEFALAHFRLATKTQVMILSDIPREQREQFMTIVRAKVLKLTADPDDGPQTESEPESERGSTETSAGGKGESETASPEGDVSAPDSEPDYVYADVDAVMEAAEKAAVDEIAEAGAREAAESDEYDDDQMWCCHCGHVSELEDPYELEAGSGSEGDDDDFGICPKCGEWNIGGYRSYAEMSRWSDEDRPKKKPALQELDEPEPAVRDLIEAAAQAEEQVSIDELDKLPWDEAPTPLHPPEQSDGAAEAKERATAKRSERKQIVEYIRTMLANKDVPESALLARLEKVTGEEFTKLALVSTACLIKAKALIDEWQMEGGDQ